MNTSATSEVGAGIVDWQCLLDARERDAWLRRSGVPIERSAASYLRVKDGQAALLGLEMSGVDAAGEPVALSGYVRAESPVRAAELAAKWHGKRSVETAFGTGVRLLEGGASVLFLFPNDARIRGMRFVADVDKLKRMLADLPGLGADGWRTRGRKSWIETVRYKPERRLIQRAILAQKNDRTGAKRTREVFLRFFVDERGSRIAAIRASLVGQPVDRHLPESFGAVDAGRMFVEAAVPGGPLLPELRRAAVAPGALAEILLDLHASQAAGLAAWTMADIRAAARSTIDVLGHAAESLRSLLDPIDAALAARQPVADELVTSHGDAHLHQFLAGTDGPKLVDFERMVRAPRAYDLGHLRAHILLMAQREPADREVWLRLADAVGREYAERQPGLDVEALAFCTACGLLERALLPYRRADADWQRESAVILELVRAELTATSAASAAVVALPCDVIYPKARTPWAALRRVDGALEFGTFAPETGRYTGVDPAADAALPGLLNHGETGELVGYRYGRRAIKRVTADTGETKFLKFVKPRRAEAIAARHREVAGLVAAQGAALVVPRLLAADLHNGVLEFAALPGVSLHARGACRPEDLTIVAHGLVAFHSLEPVAETVLPDYRGHAPLAEHAAHLAWVDVALHSRCAAFAESLGPRDAVADTGRLVHGDLHDKNLWLPGAGLGLIDLDSVAVGDPAEDLGNLAAHFVLRALQNGPGIESGRQVAVGYLAAYEAAGGRLDRPLVTRVLVETLVRLCCLYRFRRRWVGLCEPLLDEAAYWLGRQI